ncbi:hypothetical protein [Spirosoma fluviale]|uniref:Uncharacterized protein n=1 Tax=Spirosoma fluviale TaxID=1597977 RepID=A0A286F6N4_9BACT|nr:hypothetical protein [Spirosoma fluviale]SOD78875.1 hypothetical protein SAMN06269250_0685 [Spirosoma fluviale]
MNPYILDYSEPDDLGRRPGHNNRRKRRNQPIGLIFIVLNGLLYCIALVYLLRQHTEIKQIRQDYNDQVIQYDSLLAAKLETEQQLAALHRQIALTKRAGLSGSYP